MEPPDPKKFPLLAYVLSQIDPNSYPFLPSELGQDLMTRLPHLANPKVVSRLTQSIPESIDRTQTLLAALGPRPDPLAVSAARLKLAELGDGGSAEAGIYAAVVRLDEMHAEYEKQLRDAELRLVEAYRSAVEKELGGASVVDEEVVRILREAEGEAAAQMERVELSGRQLRFVPEAFGKLSSLVVMNLSNNELEVIPDAIAGLKSLQELDVSSNLLRSLPDSIGLLVSLKILNVSSNKLTALPESIAWCSSLEVLDASFNNLSCLPTNIGFGLSKLEKLSISLNKIRILPTSICEMRSLRYLDAHFNELHGLPQAIGKLTNLEALNISSNFSDMRELPDSFGDLISLRELDLSNNQIRALPDSFYRLDNLTKLNLEQNPLIVPPLEIALEGAHAVREYMMKRWHDMIAEEQERSAREASRQQAAQSSWIGWGTSMLGGLATGVSQSVSGYLHGGNSAGDPYLDQQL
ncbi:hypothetical protein CDL15_Pgr024436 [Punica granatum]|uniref:Plant intracellular Ras-group-related LRR protein 3 n=1 Tax=Punica granatum TaxID=22663 RepID=A0A218XY36_PUNGR|nr:hypothetical protein CDL15_Pgr024436 [Punica granatum]PKI38824.1 hypothetical protein CRG98_040797 [Punica granatum]